MPCSQDAEGTKAQSRAPMPVVRSMPASPPSTRRETSANTLENGGAVMGPDGVELRALSDTLAAPIEVFLSTGSAPAETLPAEVTPRGDFFNIRAGADTYVSTIRPFVVSVPVPSGADTGRLVLAALVPADKATDVTVTGRVWLFIDGIYDPDRNAFITTIPFLAGDGRTFALVEHPDGDSSVAGGSGAGARPVEVPNDDVPMVGFDFFVRCRGLLPAECSQGVLADVADRLEEARFQLTSMNYFEPRLAVEVQEVGPEHALQGIGYRAYVTRFGSELCRASETGIGGRGIYHSEIGALYICFGDPAGGIDAVYANTVVHEYFHATQSAYPAYLTSTNEAWLAEGTATAAGDSYLNTHGIGDLMVRDPLRPFRLVDIGLRSTDKSYEYEAQDFWVFAGEQFAVDMDALIPIFANGGTLSAIDAGLFGDRLKQMYWAWAKNQLMEKDIDFAGTLHFPCSIEYGVLQSGMVASTWPWFPIARPNPFMGTLGPLETTVVEMIPVDAYPAKIRIEELSSKTDPYLIYKVYEDPATTCRDVADRERELEPDVQKSYYIVISNLSFDETKTYVVNGEVIIR